MRYVAYAVEEKTWKWTRKSHWRGFRKHSLYQYANGEMVELWNKVCPYEVDSFVCAKLLRFAHVQDTINYGSFVYVY